MCAAASRSVPSILGSSTVRSIRSISVPASLCVRKRRSRASGVIVCARCLDKRCQLSLEMVAASPVCSHLAPAHVVSHRALRKGLRRSLQQAHLKGEASLPRGWDELSSSAISSSAFSSAQSLASGLLVASRLLLGLSRSLVRWGLPGRTASRRYLMSFRQLAVRTWASVPTPRHPMEPPTMAGAVHQDTFSFLGLNFEETTSF